MEEDACVQSDCLQRKKEREGDNTTVVFFEGLQLKALVKVQPISVTSFSQAMVMAMVITSKVLLSVLLTLPEAFIITTSNASLSFSVGWCSCNVLCEMSQSSSSRSSAISSGTSTSTSTSADTDEDNSGQQRARLQALLKKHLTADRVKASRIEAYHQREFIGRLEDIVQRWMAGAVFSLQDLASSQLTEAVEETMISRLQADLERHFPLPQSDEAIHQLDELYRSVPSPVADANGNVNNANSTALFVAPKFHRSAYLLPTGALPENATIVGLYFKTLRPLLVEAQDSLWRLSVAIHLLAPTVADSHNTGLAVQRRVLKAIRSLKHFIGELLTGQGWLAYAQQRAAHLKAVHRLPQSAEARAAYIAFERAYIRFLRTAVRDLAAELLVLQHTIVQHLDAIKAPRLDHTANLAARILN